MRKLFPKDLAIKGVERRCEVRSGKGWERVTPKASEEINAFSPFPVTKSFRHRVVASEDTHEYKSQELGSDQDMEIIKGRKQLGNYEQDPSSGADWKQRRNGWEMSVSTAPWWAQNLPIGNP